MSNDRRTFIKTLVGSPLLLNSIALSNEKEKRRIACQQYNWFTFYRRDGKVWGEDIEQSYGDLLKAGFNGFEASFDNVEQSKTNSNHLHQKNIQTHSIYVNSTLHDEQAVVTSMEQVLAIANVVKSYGVKIIVTNPSPINWNSKEDKTDEQLKTQAKALNNLGKRLKALGISLAYHNHDSEMRNSAREFHHMMNGTDPEHVKLCLDAHWIYRGAGDSQVALFDIVQLYLDRIIELHIRQSKNGVWTEEFCEGDIDYRKLARMLYANNSKPHLVLEQCIESESPNTMNAIKAHKLGLDYLNDVFVDLIQ